MSFKIDFTEIKDVLILEPQVYTDPRGAFYESFNQRKFEEIIGRQINFVQDNHSVSRYGVLRGLHYQLHKPQGKLVRVIKGTVLDVAVDLRVESCTFGQWVSVTLSDSNKRQLWVPEGFAHGFMVLSEYAEFLYKTTDYWYPEHERCILWNDPDLQIAWPDSINPVLSSKDKSGTYLRDADVFI